MRGKKERKKRLYPVVWKSLLFFMSLGIIGSVAIFYLTLPDTIRVVKGEEGSLYDSGLLRLTIEEPEKHYASEPTILPNGEIEIESEPDDYVRANATLSLCGIPLKTVNLQMWEKREVIVCGQTVGLDIYTDGVMVLGTGKLVTAQGEIESPAKGSVFTGDRIDKVNRQPVHSAQEVLEAVKNGNGQPVILTLRRNDHSMDVAVTPVLTQEGAYKIGLWIRDRAQGIGTLTYYDPKSGGYGAVGHGITDVDTGEIIPAGKGTLTGARIRGLTKGQKGQPGEVEASLTPLVYGDIQANTDKGVFGRGETAQITGVSYPIAFRSQIKDGKAQVLTDLVTGSPEGYEVRIEKITTGIGGRSAMIVEITDERLLQVTGGIVQGMSGCPLIQNGRLIGAVTHVFIKEPTRGYGIYIEDMVEEMMKEVR